MIKKVFPVLCVALLVMLCAKYVPGEEKENVPYYAEEILFSQQGNCFFRIPTLIATKDGTVLAAVNARWGSAGDFVHTTLVARRRSSGENWGPIWTVGGDEKNSCVIGSSVYDSQKDRIFLFGGNGVYISNDDANSFSFEKLKLYSNKESGKKGGTHGSAPGKMLTQGEHAGRLLVPARYAYGKETAELQRKRKEFAKYLQEKNYNCAIFSDDHGATWNTSGPVQIGTGEGSLVELKDGRIFYNSRAYFLDGKRRTAISTDGGSTFNDFKIAEDLVEPPLGCNASMIRITTRKGDDFLLYSGPQSEKKRTDLCIMISRDNGSHWKRLFNFTPGMFGAYSALAWSEKDQRIYFLYESNKYNPKINYGEFVFAEFNPEWIYRMEETKSDKQ